MSLQCLHTAVTVLQNYLNYPCWEISRQLTTALNSVPDLQLVLQFLGDVVHRGHDLLGLVTHLHVVCSEPRIPDPEPAVVGVDERLDVAAPL